MMHFCRCSHLHSLSLLSFFLDDQFFDFVGFILTDFTLKILVTRNLRVVHFRLSRANSIVVRTIKHLYELLFVVCIGDKMMPEMSDDHVSFGRQLIFLMLIRLKLMGRRRFRLGEAVKQFYFSLNLLTNDSLFVFALSFLPASLLLEYFL